MKRKMKMMTTKKRQKNDAETKDGEEKDTEDESSAEIRGDTESLCAMIGYSSFDNFMKAGKGDYKAQKGENARVQP